MIKPSVKWEPNEELDALNHRAYSIRATDPPLARKLAHEALQKSTELEYSKGRADALRTLGSLESYEDRAAGFQLAIQAIAIYSELEDEFGESSALLTSSLYFQYQGWYLRAHELLVESHEKAVRSGNEAVASVALYNLGVNARERQDYEQSLDYFLRAREAAERGENHAIYWVTVVDCEIVRFFSTPFDCNLAAVEAALEKLLEMKSFANAIAACHFIAQYSGFIGDHAKSKLMLRKGHKLAVQHKKAQKIWALRHLKGELAFNRGNVAGAKRSLEAALLFARMQGNREGESKTLELLSRVYFAVADSTQAYLSLSRHQEIRNHLYNEETDRRMREMQTIHQVRMIESESVFLKAKNEELHSINAELENALQAREELQRELERIATTDDLTGVFNRRQILHFGSDMITRYHSLGRKSTVLILDLDNFKSINDTFGHNIGDEVLRRFTRSCERVLRPTDRLGRLGGEEFCILLDNTNEQIAELVAERILQAIRTTRTSDIMEDRGITASIGICGLGARHSTIEAALHDADLALYAAKNTGRNRACVYQQPDSAVA